MRQAQAQATVGRERPAKPAARRPTAMADRGAQAALEAVPAGRDLVMSMMAVMAALAGIFDMLQTARPGRKTGA